jgi:dienelactone hydrolase
MNTTVPLHRVLIVGTLLGVLASGIVGAQVAVTTEKLSFDVAGAFERGATVSGDLRLPASRRERLPAVVILHSTPGFDGRGAFYAEALNQAGIATVEIDYMQGKGMPATPRHNLPHVYQTLQYLARHPRIDEARIGILGVSYGGTLTLLTSSDELTQEHTGGTLRFAAHLGIYPICWRHSQVLAGTTWQFKRTVYQRVTGRPVHILAGEKDDYDDDPDSCAKFLAALPPQVRQYFDLTVYPGATFGWTARSGARPGTPARSKAKEASGRSSRIPRSPNSLGLRGRLLHEELSKH